MEEALLAAQSLGLAGPAPVELHIRHARGFAEMLGDSPGTLLDLGSGAGLPGLALAAMLPETHFVLLDSNLRRASFLSQAIITLGLGGRLIVLHERAEQAAHLLTWRESFDTVVSRSFGRPATTAECGAGFLRPGGTMIVSEPPPGRGAPSEGGSPAGAGRWPAEGLSKLGLAPRPLATVGGFSFETLDKTETCPPAYPRRNGLPRRRPLF